MNEQFEASLKASLKLQLRRALDEYLTQKARLHSVENVHFQGHYEQYVEPFLDACEHLIAVQHELLDCDSLDNHQRPDLWDWTGQF